MWPAARCAAFDAGRVASDGQPFALRLIWRRRGKRGVERDRSAPNVASANTPSAQATEFVPSHSSRIHEKLVPHPQHDRQLNRQQQAHEPRKQSHHQHRAARHFHQTCQPGKIAGQAASIGRVEHEFVGMRE